jgi:TldD protein
MKIKLSALLLLTVLSVSVALAAAESPKPAASQDPVLSAMQEEMDRSKSQLKLEDVPAPYYLDYRITDLDTVDAQATFGAVRSEVRTRIRVVRVVVRIGDYKQDSFFNQGEGAVDFVPQGDDVLALRHGLWLATDQAYKQAAQALTAKQAQLKQYSLEQTVDDFAHVQPVQSLGELVKLDYDSARWLAMLRNATKLYTSDPLLEACEAHLNIEAINRYFISSEGTAIRSGQSTYQLQVQANTQAADGMALIRSKVYTVSTVQQLPSPQEFQRDTAELLATLKKLRDAPVVAYEYRGPVLFSADAAATVFANLIGENVLGVKPGPGEPGRTTGAFATSYKARVLPEIFSVTDDPTVASFDGQPVIGQYEFDDEGVKASRVALIEKGKLTNYLVGRKPIRDFPVSNGHGRARVPAYPPGPGLGNLIVTSSETLSVAELKKKLIQLCQERGLEYGYYVETTDPESSPRLLYRVWVKDGREELVRGATFDGLDEKTLRNNVIAAGNDVFVDNRTLNIPHSIVSPSILFDELEVKPADKTRDKSPEYPAPTVAGNK